MLSPEIRNSIVIQSFPYAQNLITPIVMHLRLLVALALLDARTLLDAGFDVTRDSVELNTDDGRIDNDEDCAGEADGEFEGEAAAEEDGAPTEEDAAAGEADGALELDGVG
jgi:hypothetical protein